MNNKTKRPPLTALLREQPPVAAPLSPEEQQRIQAENDHKLYGTRLLAMATLASAPAPAADVPASGSGGELAIVGDRWIPFGTYLHDQVYLTLKQAEFWEPGFEIRKFVNKVLLTALAELPGAQQALPEENLAAVLKKINRTKS
jgi:hypothetical protein